MRAWTAVQNYAMTFEWNHIFGGNFGAPIYSMKHLRILNLPRVILDPTRPLNLLFVVVFSFFFFFFSTPLHHNHLSANSYPTCDKLNVSERDIIRLHSIPPPTHPHSSCHLSISFLENVANTFICGSSNHRPPLGEEESVCRVAKAGGYYYLGAIAVVGKTIGMDRRRERSLAYPRCRSPWNSDSGDLTMALDHPITFGDLK